MVQLREPIPTVGEAREDGRGLAEEAEKAAVPGPGAAGAEFHRITGRLARHSGDPDVTSAFYAPMDPELVKNLQVAIAAADAPTAEEASPTKP